MVVVLVSCFYQLNFFLAQDLTVNNSCNTTETLTFRTVKRDFFLMCSLNGTVFKLKQTHTHP